MVEKPSPSVAAMDIPTITAPRVDIKGDRINPVSFLCMANDGGQRDLWLSRLTSDFLHPGWANIEHLLSQGAENSTSFSTIWHQLSQHAEFMAAAAFRLSEADVLHALPSELTVHWLTISLPIWEKAVVFYQVMWKTLLGDDDGSVQGALTLQERMHVLSEIVPALTITMDWIQFRNFGRLSAGIIEIARAQSESPACLIDALWSGESSLLQMELLRTHPTDQVWPSSMIAKRAFTALRKRAPESIASLIDPATRKNGQGIFWPFPDDHKAATVNIPVLMGFWAMTGVTMDWWHKSGRLRQVVEIHAFDRLWFHSAYNQGAKIALAYDLQSPYANGDA